MVEGQKIGDQGMGETRATRDVRSPEDALWFRDVFDHLFGFIGILTPDGVLVEVNRAPLEVTGFTREQVLGRPFWETGWWDGSPEVQEQLRVDFAEAVTGRSVHREAVYFTSAGEERFVDRTLTPVGDPAGRVVRVIAEGRDVTDRRRAEEALAGTERRFRAMIEHQFDGISLNAADGTVLYISPSARSLAGHAPDEVVGRSAFEFIHPGDRARTAALLGEVLRNPRVPFRIEYRVRHRDGSWRWLEAVVRNLLDEPAVRALVCNYRDVTDQRRAEDARREHEARFLGLFHQSAAGISECDPVGRFVRVNDRFCEFVGRPAESLCQLRVQDVIHPDDLPETLVLRGRAVREGRPFTAEKRYVRPDGSHVWACTSACAIPGASGEPESVMAVVIDVSERRRAEEALRRAYDELEDRVRSRTAEVEAERARLAEIFRLAPAFMAVLRGPDHVLERANDRFAEFTAGRVPLGWSVRETFPELEGQGFFEILDRVYRTGEPFVSGDARMMLDRGTGLLDERRFEFVYQPLRDAAGAVAGILLQGVDLTLRVRAEQALRESEERFARFMRHLPGRAWVKDAEGRYLYANDRVLADFRIGEEGIRGKTGEYLVRPETAARFREQDRQVIDGLAAVQIVQAVEERDGSVRQWLVTKFPIPGEGGSPTLVGGVGVDITERLRAEAANREKAELLDLAGDAITVRDAAGTIVYWNRGAETLYGWGRDEVLGKNIDGLLRTVFPTPPEVVAAEVERAGHWAGELTRTRQDGTPVVVSSRWSRRLDGDGRPYAILEISTDATERRQAAELRAQFLARLIAAQEEERGRVARELHDGVAQTLTALHLRVGALAKRAIPPEVRDELAELKRITQGALDEVRFLARGLRPPVLDELGLLPALTRYTEDFSRIHAIRAEVVVGDGLGGRFPPEVETALYRIAQEALANVARHSRASAASVVVFREPGFVQLLVEDNGVGWDPEAAPASGDAYHHLGLQGMRERAALLGGVVLVESSPGGGTTVCVRLPLGAVA